MSQKASSNRLKHPFEILLVVYLCYEHVSHGIDWITMGVAGISTISQSLIVSYILIAAIFVLALAKNYTHIREWPADIFGIILLFATLYGLSSFQPETLRAMEDLNLPFHTFIECLPVYVFFRLSKDYEALWRYLLIASTILFAICVLSFLVYNVGSTTVYRTFSAAMSIPAAVFMIDWLQREDKRSMLLMFLSVFLMATCGRRSSVVSILAVFIIMCILEKKYYILVPAVSLTMIALIFVNSNIEIIDNIIRSFGVRPRNITRFLSDTLTDDSHRFAIWNQVMSAMTSSAKNTLFGLGLAGDRPYLFYSTNLIGSDLIRYYPYPHSIVVEILADYGIIAGPIILMFLLILGPIQTYINIKDNNNKCCLFFFSLCFVIPLLFQSSYLISKFFYLYLAIIFTFAFIPNRRSRRQSMYLKENETDLTR